MLQVFVLVVLRGNTKENGGCRKEVISHNKKRRTEMKMSNTACKILDLEALMREIVKFSFIYSVGILSTFCFYN